MPTSFAFGNRGHSGWHLTLRLEPDRRQGPAEHRYSVFKCSEAPDYVLVVFSVRLAMPVRALLELTLIVPLSVALA